jgi:hypothetical protein
MHKPAKWRLRIAASEGAEQMKSSLTSGIVLLGLLVISGLPASAQSWANNNQQLMFEDGNFHHFAVDNPRIAQDLMRDPNLANDPRYLATHPQLTNFMKQYPNAGATLRANPQAFLHQDARRTTGGNYPGGHYAPYPTEHHHHHHDDHWHY